jgi:hypothetical protein
VLAENLIQSRIERWTAVRGRSWVATHIEACFACRFRVPIAIGDSVVRGIDPVDLDFTVSPAAVRPILSADWSIAAAHQRRRASP